MRGAAARLRQRDGVSCGPAVAVMAAALSGPGRTGSDPVDPRWFAAEQARVHRRANVIWPRALGTTPMGMAKVLGQGHRWRLYRGAPRRREVLAGVLAAVGAGAPVAMLIGGALPRHWVLIVAVRGSELQCYEPSSGEVRRVDLAAVRRARITGLGYRRTWAFVVPSEPVPHRPHSNI